MTNTSRQQDDAKNPHFKKISDGVYYCTLCCLAVPVYGKTNHRRSKKHQYFVDFNEKVEKVNKAFKDEVREYVKCNQDKTREDMLEDIAKIRDKHVVEIDMRLIKRKRDTTDKANSA